MTGNANGYINTIIGDQKPSYANFYLRSIIRDLWDKITLKEADKMILIDHYEKYFTSIVKMAKKAKATSIRKTPWSETIPEFESFSFKRWGENIEFSVDEDTEWEHLSYMYSAAWVFIWWVHQTSEDQQLGGEKTSDEILDDLYKLDAYFREIQTKEWWYGVIFKKARIQNIIDVINREYGSSGLNKGTSMEWEESDRKKIALENQDSIYSDAIITSSGREISLKLISRWARTTQTWLFRVPDCICEETYTDSDDEKHEDINYNLDQQIAILERFLKEISLDQDKGKRIEIG